eukprot:Blabericola_migrator_1__1976@NODE_153_length_12753_cov_114_743891_g134_i0_p4_GENE_NODE_153_length_12753_cov_114_743891_g134_i0NODE_153_length_12753_cov_114_743891_g134_i0_p4_ORF_typecomplete_len378_score26_30_NODE_153_length_12753_cov_114_743891_g134_i0491182
MIVSANIEIFHACEGANTLRGAFSFMAVSRFVAVVQTRAQERRKLRGSAVNAHASLLIILGSFRHLLRSFIPESCSESCQSFYSHWSTSCTRGPFEVSPFEDFTELPSLEAVLQTRELRREVLHSTLKHLSLKPRKRSDPPTRTKYEEHVLQLLQQWDSLGRTCDKVKANPLRKLKWLVERESAITSVSAEIWDVITGKALSSELTTLIVRRLRQENIVVQNANDLVQHLAALAGQAFLENVIREVSSVQDRRLTELSQAEHFLEALIPPQLLNQCGRIDVLSKPKLGDLWEVWGDAVFTPELVLQGHHRSLNVSRAACGLKVEEALGDNVVCAIARLAANSSDLNYLQKLRGFLLGKKQFPLCSQFGEFAGPAQQG